MSLSKSKEMEPEQSVSEDLATPLLASSSPVFSGNANDLNDAERQSPARKIKKFGKKSKAFLALGVISFLCCLLIIGLVVGINKLRGQEKLKRNVILMISDGFGPASETFARTYYQYIHNMSDPYISPLDEILVGSSRTRSSSSYVTDSAAGATAFSCALKTYNGAIGVNPQKKPCGTVLEAAKKKNYKTGLVATSRITHATPASFNSHVVFRDYENDIAENQIGNYPLGLVTDVMLGGGRRHFVPKNDPESVRSDDRNLLAEARARGMHVITSRQEFDSLNSRNVSNLPLLGTFTSDHMSYEIDRDASEEPSLKEMAAKALDLLFQSSSNDKDSPGFFIMIEGSRIDMAAHSNDPVAHVHEIFMYHETVQYVKQFVSDHPGTVLISVSDHETGGFSLARQLTEAYPEYLWRPEVLTKIKNSTSILASAIVKYNGTNVAEYIQNAIVGKWLGLTDVTEEELRYLGDDSKKAVELDYFMGQMVSKRAQLGWATHGHSGVDVNLYAYGTNAEQLAGNHENTDIGLFITKYLDVDVAEITTLLQSDFMKHQNLPKRERQSLFKANGHGLILQHN